MRKLVSVIITSYQIFEFIYEAIDSVLCQSYGPIELLICDDGSDNFPEEQIQSYIERHKGSNLYSLLIDHANDNRGTVKNLNHALRLAHGEYIGLLAADDAYFDAHVLERFVSGFELMDPCEDCYLEMAQTAMCGRTLKRIDGYALFQNVREAAEHGGKELFGLVAYCECLPTVSFFYKKEFFEKFGGFDEDFYLIEDYPMHCRIVREGWKIHFENFAAVKHRNGGISRGNAGGLTKSAYWYDLDILKIREKYVKPYYHMLEKKDAKDVKDKAWTEEKWAKSQVLLYEKDAGKEKCYLREYRWTIRKDMLCRSRYRLTSLAVQVLEITFCLAAVIPQAELVLLHAGRMAGVGEAVLSYAYLSAWLLLVFGIGCGLAGLIGKVIADVEAFP